MNISSEVDIYDRFAYVSRIPGIIVVKNSQSDFINISQDAAKLLNYKTAHDCIGKTDYELPCKLAELAHEFRTLDRKMVSSNQKITTLEIVDCALGWIALLIQRIPIIDDKERSAGVYLQLTDASDFPQFNSYFSLYKNDLKLIGTPLKPIVYVLNDSNCPFNLTKHQQMILSLLMRRKTMKEIAKILNRSLKKIICDLNVLKDKMKCSTKSELIEKGIDNDLFYSIPRYMTIDA